LCQRKEINKICVAHRVYFKQKPLILIPRLILIVLISHNNQGVRLLCISPSLCTVHKFNVISYYTPIHCYAHPIHVCKSSPNLIASHTPTTASYTPTTVWDSETVSFVQPSPSPSSTSKTRPNRHRLVFSVVHHFKISP
jgi:hypothetical protein